MHAHWRASRQKPLTPTWDEYAHFFQNLFYFFVTIVFFLKMNKNRRYLSKLKSQVSLLYCRRQIWCDVGKSVWSQTWHFQVSFRLKCSFGGVHFADNSTCYGQLKDSQNNKKQRKSYPFSGYISQSMLPIVAQVFNLKVLYYLFQKLIEQKVHVISSTNNQNGNKMNQAQ